MNDGFAQALFLTALAAIALVLAFGLRWVIKSGRGAVAGLVAGALLGPAITGKIVPDWYERVIIGGQVERQLLDRARSERTARTLAAEHLVMPLADDASEADAIRERELAMTAAWRQAQWRERAPLRLAAVAVVALFFLLAGVTRRERAGPAPHPYQASSIGIWAAALPGSLFLIVCRWHEVPLPEAIIASSAIACGAAVIARGDLIAADEAEVGGGRLIAASAAVALLTALAISVGAAWWMAGWERTMLLAAPAAIVIGWALPRLEQSFVIAVRDGVLTPLVTAFLAVRIELFEHFWLWLVLVALLLSGDGRWFGAFLGAMFSGVRRSLRTMRLVLGAMSAGTAQIGIACAALHAGFIPEEAAYALLLGGVMMETMTGARRRIAQRIEETEEEISAIRLE